MGIKDLYDSEDDSDSDGQEPIELEVTGLAMLAKGENPQDLLYFKHQKKN